MRHVSDIGTQIYGDPEQRSEFVQRMLKEGQVVHAEQQVCRKDGKKNLDFFKRPRPVQRAGGAPLF
jgi:hypothetical protein